MADNSGGQMQEVLVDTLPMDAYKAAREDGKGSGDSVSIEELKANEAEKTPSGKESFEDYKVKRESKHKGGYQKRIDRIVAERESL